MGKMIFTLPGGLKVERESNFGVDPYKPEGSTPAPTPTPKPTPEPTPEPSPEGGEEDSPLVKAVKAVEEVVKPKARRGRKKKTDAES